MGDGPAGFPRPFPPFQNSYRLRAARSYPECWPLASRVQLALTRHETKGNIDFHPSRSGGGPTVCHCSAPPRVPSSASVFGHPSSSAIDALPKCPVGFCLSFIYMTAQSAVGNLLKAVTFHYYIFVCDLYCYPLHRRLRSICKLSQYPSDL